MHLGFCIPLIWCLNGVLNVCAPTLHSPYCPENVNYKGAVLGQAG